MLLKAADDKSKRIALLEDLQKSPLLDARQKKWLREELGRLRKGIQGERDSAYFLGQYFKDAENYLLMHDLRITFEGDVAQIDHLVFNRGLGVYLIETKNYAGNVDINAHGEFTVDYDGDRFGVPSPIEQSKRQGRILARLFERLGITNRMGGALELYHVVMFHPKAIINRPDAKAFDTSNVIKADQFPTWHSKFVDKELIGPGIFKAGINLRSVETVREWAEKLIRQHRPANLLDLPDFMQPKEAPPPPRPVPAAQAAATKQTSPKTESAAPTTDGAQKKLVCMQCGTKINYAEGKFCWNNPKRFGGGQYCREHQTLF